MQELANATGNEEDRLNLSNYNSIISALVNSQGKGTASRAEKILELMDFFIERQAMNDLMMSFFPAWDTLE